MDFIRFIVGMEAVRKNLKRVFETDELADKKELYAILQEKQQLIRAAIKARDAEREKQLWIEYCGTVATFFAGEMRKGVW